MDDHLAIARGAGNVSELGPPSRAVDPLKAMLAERIRRELDRIGMSLRAAAAATGFAAADYSRVRQGRLERFTVDRLMAMLGGLNPGIELTLLVRPELTRNWAIARLLEREPEIRALGITGLSLFGSTARNEAGGESDVDILVEHDRAFDLTKLITLKVDLEEELGVPIHVTDRPTLKPELREQVESEAIRVF